MACQEHTAGKSGSTLRSGLKKACVFPLVLLPPLPLPLSHAGAEALEAKTCGLEPRRPSLSERQPHPRGPARIPDARAIHLLLPALRFGLLCNIFFGKREEGTQLGGGGGNQSSFSWRPASSFIWKPLSLSPCQCCCGCYHLGARLCGRLTSNSCLILMTRVNWGGIKQDKTSFLLVKVGI